MKDRKTARTSQPPAAQLQGAPEQDDLHEAVHYPVGNGTEKGKRKVRYMETSDPKKGFRSV